MYRSTHETTPRQTAIERALVILNSVGILTDLNRDIVISHEDPVTVRDAIVLLNVKNLLTQLEASEHLCAILLHQDPTAVANAIIVLDEKNLLTDENIKNVVADPEPLELVQVIVESVSHINDINVLSQYPKRSAGQTVTITLPKSVRKSHVETLKNDIDTLIQGQALFSREEALGLSNIKAIADHQDRAMLIKVLIFMEKQGLLADKEAQGNFDAIINHQNLVDVAQAFIIIRYNDVFLNPDKIPAIPAKYEDNQLNNIENNENSLRSTDLQSIDNIGKNDSAGITDKIPLILKSDGSGMRAPDSETQLYFNAIVGNRYPMEVAKALVVLKKINLLENEKAQAIVKAVKDVPNPVVIAEVFVLFQGKGLLLDEQVWANLDAIVAHPRPIDVANNLIQLKNSNRLSQVNIRLALNDDSDLTTMLKSLSLSDTEAVPMIGSKRPRGDFFKSIARKQQHLLAPSEMLSEMLSELTDSGLFIGEQGQNNFDTITLHDFAVDVAKALIELKKNDLLAGEQGQVNFAVTVTHRYPRELAPALIFLQKSGLLADNQAQKNFDAIVGHEHPMKVANAFITLKEADRLSEDNIKALLEVAPEDLEELIQCLLLSDVVSAHL